MKLLCHNFKQGGSFGNQWAHNNVTVNYNIMFLSHHHLETLTPTLNKKPRQKCGLWTVVSSEQGRSADVFDDFNI